MNFNGIWFREESSSEFSLSGPYGFWKKEYIIEYTMRSRKEAFKTIIDIEYIDGNRYEIIGGTVFGDRASIEVLGKEEILISGKYCFRKK